MRDLKAYWQEIRALEKSLPQYVWLMSLDDAKRGMVGGRMAEVGAASAAQLLHAGSHRRATDEEIDAHLVRENDTRRRSFLEDLRHKGIAVVPVPIASKPEANARPASTRRR
jgi:hypothetical protein